MNLKERKNQVNTRKLDQNKKEFVDNVKKKIGKKRSLK